ncbi:LysR family transcriptional regulator [Vibrio ulleungensis]|uniref:LysR family transcriptional regulator n=1 Tax=Vibrio ulleungensis TaxID=2807619 RepID=A0ABS2HLZ9_9VIBR|nr:LysR family transcriptional regulator [Vibrio ulleungensis]MBM7037238.1 LysR family transcriptional regulator [Vibrio ulleungensis]
MSRVSIEQLSAFVAVAKHGSFSRAAKVLKKDRATIHQQVGNLEIDWNMTLFDRSKRAPVLLDAAKGLLNHAEHILFQMDSLNERSHSLASGVEQSVTIAHDMSLTAADIAKIHHEALLSFPYTRLNWVQRDRASAIDDLLTEQADLAVCLKSALERPEGNLKFTVLGGLRFAFYAHKASHLASQQSISMAALEKEQQYIPEFLIHSPIGKNVVLSASNSVITDDSVLLKLLEKGGWAVFPAHYVKLVASNELRQLDVEFLVDTGSWAYELLTREGASFGPVARFVKQQLLDTYHQYRTML